MSSSNVLEEQIVALVHQLKETREAKKREDARKEAEWKEPEAAAERACQKEQRRLQAEAEAEAECKRCDAEEHRVKQERWEKEEEKVRHRQSCQESTLTPVAAPEMELPWSKGKGPELAPESEGGQESWRCDSCERQNVECICIKVSDFHLKFSITDSPVDRQIPLLPPMPGGPGQRHIKKGPDGPRAGVGDETQSPTGATRRSHRSQLASV